MAEERVQRRLAAILAADVAGYSRLMGVDEEGTLAALKAHRRELIDPAIAAHSGRIVKTTGDGVLVEFASVVDAVRCAVEIQRGMAGRNSDVPEDRRITFRIGINVGDIIIDGDDIYGDGVNVAARLETLAEPGGVCVSRAARDQVRDRLDLALEDMGEQSVKNIARPVRAFRVVVAPLAPVGVQESATGATEDRGLSIVVLPFVNMSGDAEQEYFSDGITEDIITDLSKVSALFVIARNSAFTFKGRAVKIPDICRELDVSYALEGSVRRAGNRVRITAQLIDGSRGGHLWAERYDRDLSDIFEVQDDVTRQIVGALKIKLSEAEKSRLVGGGTKHVDAHDLFLKGRELMYGPKRDHEMFRQSMACFRRAVELDPDYAGAYAGLSMGHVLDYQNHWSDAPDKSLDEAKRDVDQALSKDDKDPFAHYVAAVVAMWQRDYERWACEGDRALSLNPNYALALMTRGILHIYTGEPAKAIPYIERAMRLDPAARHGQCEHFLGTAYLVGADYGSAATWFKKRIAMNPRTDMSRAFLASALGHLGESEEARRIWHELEEINPKYSFDGHVGRLPFRDPADAERLKDGLRKAGLQP